MAYTTINKSGDYFNTKTWTGNDASGHAITGVGFQPDFVWIKNRNTTDDHNLFDSVRGNTKIVLSNSTSAEITNGSRLESFDSDGITVGADNDTNRNGDSIVGWNWKANGTGSANTDGSVNSTVSVNSTAGFSIVKYVGDGASTTTVGHGLGVVPQVILIKNLETATNWTMYHHSMGNTGQLYLDTNNSFTTDADTFKNTTPTNTLWTMSNSAKTNQGSRNHIAYCFAEKPGYSKFGSYTGNGNADGTFVYTGFKPAFVIVKPSNYADNWHIIDNKINPSNTMDKHLFANLNIAENTSSSYNIDFLSNGFKPRNTNSAINGSYNYIYMAFGQSLVGSNNIPCTAR